MFIFPCSVQAVSMRAELRALFIACLTQGCTSPPAAAAPGGTRGPRPGESLGAKGGSRGGDGQKGPSEMGSGRDPRREAAISNQEGAWSEASRGQPRPSPGEPGRWWQGAPPLGKHPWGMQKHPSSPSAKGDFKRKGGKGKKKKAGVEFVTRGGGDWSNGSMTGDWGALGWCGWLLQGQGSGCAPQPLPAPALFWGDGL